MRRTAACKQVRTNLKKTQISIYLTHWKLVLFGRMDKSRTWVIPQSRMHSLPSLVRSRFPGCGSQCKHPVSKSIVRYALSATLHSLGTSAASDWSSRAPSTHSLTRTCWVESSCETMQSRQISSGEQGRKGVGFIFSRLKSPMMSPILSRK